MAPLLVGALTVPVATQALAPVAFNGAAASDTDRLRDKQKDVRNQIDDAEQHVEESSKRIARAAAALRSSQASLVTAQADLEAVLGKLEAAKALDAEMRARLETAESQLARAQADVVAGEQAVEDQRVVVRDLVVALYQQGDPTLVSLSGYFGAQTPTDLMRRDQFALTANAKQQDVFDQLEVAEALLAQREDEVEQARDAVADRRAQAADNLAEMRDLTEQSRAAKQRVVGLIATNRANQVEARRAKQADLRELRRLEREEERIKRQIMAAVAAANADSGPGYTGSADGLFDQPVNGYVTSPFGYRVHPIYGYYGLHDGTDFGAGCGTPMRAVAAGTVVSAYYSSSYGNRLFVNVGRINGHNVVAVYNHASSYRVGVGDRVARGETVGYVGSTGWSTGCHLHFTVLQDGTAADPMGYL